MGKFIATKDFINDNIFKYENRLESQYTIFLEQTPTFVTYYRINNINTIIDTGFLNVEAILGSNSPIKFQLIKDFPIYGIEQMKFDISESDEGLNTTYESDGIILPNTIVPQPSDMFQISYLDKDYLFQVTSIEYDTIKSNNFYKISFRMRSIDGVDIELIQKQVFEKYICEFKNIGTEDKCIIEESSFITIAKLKKIYDEYIRRYMALFYSKKFNSFIFMDGNTIIYDKFLSHFIMSNGIMSKDDMYDSLVLTNEDVGIQFPILYDESIYHTIESRNIDNVDYIRYATTAITYQNSIFAYYNKLDNVRSIWFVDCGQQEYINDELINAIYEKNIPNNINIIDEIFISYFIKDHTIHMIDLERFASYKIQYTFNDYIKIPMILYMIQRIIYNFMRV